MPVGEMCARMSAHELTVIWPNYFAWKAREEKRQEKEDDRKARRRQ